MDKMRRRVVGEYLRTPRPFDPKVDAVTKATMTSAIIFDQLALGEELMQQLEQRVCSTGPAAVSFPTGLCIYTVGDLPNRVEKIRFSTWRGGPGI